MSLSDLKLFAIRQFNEPLKDNFMSNEVKMFINNRKDRVSLTINFRHNSSQMASNRFFFGRTKQWKKNWKLFLFNVKLLRTYRGQKRLIVFGFSARSCFWKKTVKIQCNDAEKIWSSSIKNFIWVLWIVNFFILLNKHEILQFLCCHVNVYRLWTHKIQIQVTVLYCACVRSWTIS